MAADLNAVARIWTAVDSITKPTRVPVRRADDPEWLTHIRLSTDEVSCSLLAYRAATAPWGTIPSLWDQSSNALTHGNETQERPGGNQAERAPCDIDLMEIRAIIRETTELELFRRHQPRTGDVPQRIRRLAATVITHEPAELWWWEYRFASWARLLATYLRALDASVKPVRLRNSACPLCKTRQVTVESDYGPVVVPALVIDFRDGYVRAAECSACGASWFRGEDLMTLADTLTGVTQVANLA